MIFGNEPSKKEIIVHLAGGLGNQLFQYFAGVSVAAKTGRNLVLKSQNIDYKHTQGLYDITSFRIQASVVKKLPRLMSQGRRPYVAMRVRLEYFLINVLRIKQSDAVIQGTYLEVCERLEEIRYSSKIRFHMKGFFQDFNFFTNLDGDLRQLELLSVSERYAHLRNQSLQNPPIAIHLRLGDFLQGNNPSIIGNLAPDYYLESLADLKKQGISGPYWIFSNDLEGAKEFSQYLNLDGNIEFVTSDFSVDPAEDLMLMSQCKALITANSTFSFWAAAFARAETPVLCPETLTKSEIYQVLNLPAGWKRIKSQWS